MMAKLRHLFSLLIDSLQELHILLVALQVITLALLCPIASVYNEVTATELNELYVYRHLSLGW